MSERQTETNKERLYFIDNLRILLAILVVVFHVALIYQNSVLTLFYSYPLGETKSSGLLAVFSMFNQAYFMGLFFFVSGYFLTSSYEKKGARVFLNDRLVKLGIPLLVYVAVLGPLTMIVLSSLPANYTGITSSVTYVQFFTDNSYEEVRVGQMWFVIMLLLFNFGYVLLRHLTRNRASNPEQKKSFPGLPSICLLTLTIAAGCYIVMIFVPVAELFLVFPSFAYFPQYIIFFTLGIIAHRNDWLRMIPNGYGIAGFIVVIISSVVLLPIVFSGDGVPERLFAGGGTWQSAVFAIWSSIIAVGFSLALIVFFRKFFNYQGKFAKFLQSQCFAVYVLHLSIIPFVAITLHNVEMQPIMKFAIVSCVSVPLCFVVAWLIRKIPHVNRIL
jgi:peptidoglycan/LPS O-acetylase OafA/YrhL